MTRTARPPATNQQAPARRTRARRGSGRCRRQAGRRDRGGGPTSSTAAPGIGGRRGLPRERELRRAAARSRASATPTSTTPYEASALDSHSVTSPCSVAAYSQTSDSARSRVADHHIRRRRRRTPRIPKRPVPIRSTDPGSGVGRDTAAGRGDAAAARSAAGIEPAACRPTRRRMAGAAGSRARETDRSAARRQSMSNHRRGRDRWGGRCRRSAVSSRPWAARRIRRRVLGGAADGRRAKGPARNG